MTNPVGKYDDECLQLAVELGARAVVLVVVAGSRGSGVSLSYGAARTPEVEHKMPALLRALADRIEADQAAMPDTH